MNNLLIFSIIFLIIITIIVSIFSAEASYSYEDYGIDPNDIYISSHGFTWPIPNAYYISSYFGYRNLNLFGASTYHSGIDIPSPEGTYFLATISGTITYLGFSGSGRIHNHSWKW